MGNERCSILLSREIRGLSRANYLFWACVYTYIVGLCWLLLLRFFKDLCVCVWWEMREICCNRGWELYTEFWDSGWIQCLNRDVCVLLLRVIVCGRCETVNIIFKLSLIFLKFWMTDIILIGTNLWVYLKIQFETNDIIIIRIENLMYSTCHRIVLLTNIFQFIMYNFHIISTRYLEKKTL